VLAPRARPASPEAKAIADAWIDSEEAFYAAGRLGDPEYAPLVSSFAAGSPGEARTVAWLSALMAAGVEAPEHYRVGNTNVYAVTPDSARLSGCTYDSGSVYRSSGTPAPAALGGGAGYTASEAVLREISGHWLVWSNQTLNVASAEESGPCHGF
jgi:hypothetical protein